MKPIVWTALVTVMVATAPATAQGFRCAATERFVCNVGIGCQPGAVGTSWVNVMPATKEYERCDQKGCDRFQAVFTPVGAFVNVEIPGRAAFAKLGPNGFFSEVVTAATMTILSYGKCSE
jgi:hypothetical protein